MFVVRNSRRKLCLSSLSRGAATTAAQIARRFCGWTNLMAAVTMVLSPSVAVQYAWRGEHKSDVPQLNPEQVGGLDKERRFRSCTHRTPLYRTHIIFIPIITPPTGLLIAIMMCVVVDLCFRQPIILLVADLNLHAMPVDRRRRLQIPAAISANSEHAMNEC